MILFIVFNYKCKQQQQQKRYKFKAWEIFLKEDRKIVFPCLTPKPRKKEISNPSVKQGTTFEVPEYGFHFCFAFQFFYCGMHHKYIKECLKHIWTNNYQWTLVKPLPLVTKFWVREYSWKATHHSHYRKTRPTESSQTGFCSGGR